MTRMLQHYRMHVQIGVSRVLVWALRCANCQTDFHVDREPRWCPACGKEVSCVVPLGEAITK